MILQSKSFLDIVSLTKATGELSMFAKPSKIYCMFLDVCQMPDRGVNIQLLPHVCEKAVSDLEIDRCFFRG